MKPERHIADIVRGRMETEGLTWKALCDRANVSAMTLKHLFDTEGAGTKVSTLEKIAEALDLSPAVFWQGEQETKAQEPEDLIREMHNTSRRLHRLSGQLLAALED